MPRLPTYSLRTRTSNSDLGSSRVSEEAFGAGSGRALSKLGDSLGNFGDAVYQRAQQSEMSDLSVKLSNINLKYSQKLKDNIQKGSSLSVSGGLGSEPNKSLSSFTDSFMEEYEKEIGELSDSISTRGAQLYLNKSSAELKNHFLSSAMAAQSELAAVQATQNYGVFENNITNSVMSDPSSFDLSAKMLDDNIENLVQTSGLPKDKAIELQFKGKSKLAEAAVRGWYQLDTAYAKEKMDKGVFDSFFSEDQKKQLYGEIKQQENANRIEEERILKEQERLKSEAQEKTQNEFLVKMVNNNLSTKDILNSNLEAFGKGSKQEFLLMLKRNQTAPIRSNSGTYLSLWSRIHLPEGDPRKIVDPNDMNSYVSGGQLSPNDYNKLRSEIIGAKTPEGKVEAQLKKTLTDGAKKRITKSAFGLPDPVGDEQYAKFLNYFTTEYAAKRKEGKSPQDLLNPESPDYLGKSIETFIRSPDEIIQDMSQGLNPPENLDAPPVPERLPNETAEDYLKRTKGGQ